jgi:hypothetical protein
LTQQVDALEKVAIRLFQEMTSLAMELEEENLPVRGRAISPEMNSLGDQAARHWLRTGQRPIPQAEKAAAFPRFWFANMFLNSALLHRTQRAVVLGRPAALPAVLMLDVWEASGKAFWESAKEEFPWGG